ncbi:MAG: flagellar hook-associated protein 3 [Candidatus Glassbacteria bacterium]|nr:flagellar hook-associated protein 3 [Candidatus Glassbacteria bacterium]
MTVRVTQNLLSTSVMRNLNRNAQNLLEIQSKLSSGKRIRRPSDDPVGTASAIRLRSQLSQTTQFLRNIESGETQLNTTDGVFNDLSGLLMRAQELAISQANVTANTNTRAAVAEEVDALINQFVDLLNTKVGNRFIFAGFKTIDTPFIQTDTGITYTGDSGEMNIEIENGTTAITNVAGSILIPSVDGDLGGHSNLFPFSEKTIPLAQRKLVDLNQGTGVDQGLIMVTNMAEATAVVDLRNAKTLEEVAFLISTARDDTGRRLMVDAVVDETSQAIVLTDRTSINDRIPGQRLEVNEVTTGRVARQLGIVGKDIDGDGVLEGRDLAPISLTTRLENLNYGSGVEKGKFQILDRAGNTAVIDTSEAETITDVRELINQAGINVRAEINSGGSGILIVDQTTGPLQNPLTISEFSENTHTARDLGILTSETGALGSLLIGSSLAPVLTRDTAVSLLNRGRSIVLANIYVENGPRTGEIDLSQAASVGEILDTINGAGFDLRAEINELGTGISVTSTVGGRTLRITDGTGGFSATALGITGSRNILVDPLTPLGHDSQLLPAVDGETRLADLNSGQGIDPGAFRITDAEGNTVYIDITNSNTLQGVINIINDLGFNGQGIVNIEALISNDLRGISIIDRSTPNTTLVRATNTGVLNITLNSLSAGDTVVVNTFDFDGVETAGYLSLVDTPSLGEQSITGTIETVDETANRISVRSGDGTLYDVTSEQPLNNLFIGQQLELNGSLNPSGQFEARTLKLVEGPGPDEQQYVGTIQSVDTLNSTVTLALADGTTRTVDLITDRSVIKVEDAPQSTAATDLGIAGTSVVGSDRIVGSALNPLITGSTKLSLLNGGTFIPGRINIQNGDRDVVVDLSSAQTVQDVIIHLNNSTAGVVAAINDAGMGISIKSRISGTTLVVNKIALKNPDGSNRKYPDGTTVFDETADLLGLTGSKDILGNLLFLKNSLLSNNQEDIQRTLNNFPDSLNRILNQRTKVGARANQLFTTRERGLDSNLRNTEILSGIEDLDVIEAINELAAAENAFNAALGAAGRIIMPSLLDFL